MVNLSPIEFSKEIINVASKSELVESFEVNILDDMIVKIRVYLTDGTFIDIFYNADTQKIAYALIKNKKRIFGIDNTDGWHLHPFKSPEIHQTCNSITFQEFLYSVEQHQKINQYKNETEINEQFGVDTKKDENRD
ncbi:MAG: hypothetical protein AB1422_04785 [bacterium]